MVDPQLMALRAALYRVAGMYNHARGIYVAAKAAHAPPETVNDAVVTCYELGAAYIAALDRLRDRLTATVQTAAHDAELERVTRFKELVERELALITPV